MRVSEWGGGARQRPLAGPALFFLLLGFVQKKPAGKATSALGAVAAGSASQAPFKVHF